MTILERVPGVNVRARRIYKAENNHIVYEGDDGPQSKISMSSLDPVESGRWYHVAAVTDKDHVFLYLDGISQGQSHAIRLPFRGTETLPVFIGATQGKHNFLSGLIDEIAVYNRALSPDEVKKIARPCSTIK
jgi:beta-galactosidase